MFSFCDLIPTVAWDTSALPLRLNSAIWPMILVKPPAVSTYIPGSVGRDVWAVCARLAAVNTTTIPKGTIRFILASSSWQEYRRVSEQLDARHAALSTGSGQWHRS